MRLKTLLMLILGTILWLHAAIASAAIVTDLYSARLVVSDQSSEAWDQALPSALQQVLIKLSGNPDVVKNALVKQSLPKAKLWVKSYSYHEQLQQGHPQLWLRFDFDTKPINQLLASMHQTVWSNDRPLTLVWLEVNDASAEGNAAIYKSLIKQNASRRGLPIILPAMDLEDQAHTNDPGSLTNPASWEWAFTHYGVKAVLVGKLKAVDNQWQGEWLVVAGSDSKQWENTASNLEDFIAAGVDEATNWMAQELTLVSGGSAKVHTLLMQVSGVQDLSDYAKISQYLSQLSFIKQVSLSGVITDGMLFRLQTVGTQEQLVKALSTSSELIADEAQHTDSQANLYYRWAQGSDHEDSAHASLNKQASDSSV